MRVASRLSPLLLQRPQAVQRQRLEGATARLQPGVARGLERASERLGALAKLYVAGSLDPERPLQRGFARVEQRADGSMACIGQGAEHGSGEEIAIKFGDQVTRPGASSMVAGDTQRPSSNPPRAAKVALLGPG